MPTIRLIFFQEDTGYGNASRSLLKQLRQTPDMTVDLVELHTGQPEMGGIWLNPVESTQQSTVQYAIIHTVPEYYPYWVAREKALNPNVKIWGYTAWETDRIPAHWPALLNLLDGVFVPSSLNREVFESSGLNVPVRVLPHISEYQGHYPANKPSCPLAILKPEQKNHFVFYTIGVWNERKNNSALIQAFLNEFRRDEAVALVVKTGTTDWINCRRRIKSFFMRSFGQAQAAFKREVRGKYSKQIHHITENLPAEQIAQLHREGHCFISLSRGEGWGMGAYEAAWFGKPVATTKFGGPLDFLADSSTYWLDYTLIPVHTAYGKQSYSPDQQWADVNSAEAGQTMRRIFENQKEAARMGIELQKNVSANFDARHIIKNLIEDLNA